MLLEKLNVGCPSFKVIQSLLCTEKYTTLSLRGLLEVRLRKYNKNTLSLCSTGRKRRDVTLASGWAGRCTQEPFVIDFGIFLFGHGGHEVCVLCVRKHRACSGLACLRGWEIAVKAVAVQVEISLLIGGLMGEIFFWQAWFRPGWKTVANQVDWHQGGLEVSRF